MEIMLQECPQINQVMRAWQYKHSIRGHICPLHFFNKILFFNNQPCSSRVGDGAIVVQLFTQEITKIAAILATWLKRKGFLSFPRTSLRAKHSIALVFHLVLKISFVPLAHSVT